jgi:hypothetical protein
MSMPKERPEWRRATYCGSTSCIEVAKVADRFLIRDSKDPGARPLSFTGDEWEAFVQAVKGNEFQFE